MATKLALVIFINLFLIFLHFSTSCLGDPPKKSSFGTKDPIKNAIASQIKKSVQKQLQKNSQTDESPTGEVPQSSGTYEITFAIGTPPQTVTSIMDISNGFTWTQCKTCDACFNQTTPLYSPELSSTYSNFSTESCFSTKVNDSSICEYFGVTSADDCTDPCPYEAEYDVDQNTTGVFATDSFTFGSNSAPNIFFGCGLENYGDYDNSSGFIGLGGGPLSVVSQFPFMRFSYCLSSDQRKNSPVNFGSLAKLQGSSGQSTPLLGTDEYPDLYYIGLVNITVGTTLLNIPSSTFELNKTGDGGVFLATIYAFTYLEQAAYDLVAQAFNSSMKNQTAADGTDLGLDLCYKNVTKWPSLTLHFEGGATLKLKTVNYVYKDPDTGIQCLAILPSSGISALGSFIQMDTNFVIDLKNKTISFEKCFDDSTSTSTSSVVSNIPHLVTTMVLFLFCILKFF
ncbi:hypothetical protein LUZ60_001372 [Juncus effusus]|nr:hypothetical protein LUZ60_001372 [Juncus effusus]